jgi:hypothetical protein
MTEQQRTLAAAAGGGGGGAAGEIFAPDAADAAEGAVEELGAAVRPDHRSNDGRSW